jgi:hypothetical protein
LARSEIRIRLDAPHEVFPTSAEQTRASMNPTVVLWQGIAVGLFVLALRLFGNVDEALIYAACVLAAAGVVWLLSRRARRRLGSGAGLGNPSERSRVLGSLLALAVVQFGQCISRLHGWNGFIHVGSHEGLVLTMLLIALSATTTIYLSSLIDWFYVRPHLETTYGPEQADSTRGSWRMVTRVRLVHRLLAVLGVLGGATAIVALAANAWVSKPLGDTAAAAISAVATIIAGYYFARAAPLVALATNPSVQICDVVELAEEFNVPDPDAPRSYFVVDIAWEGVKLLELPRLRSTGDLIAPDAPHYDRMVDVGEIAKLVRRRRPTKRG